jgi:hypothetical protein
MAWTLMRQARWAVLLAACITVEAPAQQNPTLAEVLEENSIPLPPTSIPHLTTRITSFAISNDDREFLIAYYLDHPNFELREPLLVTRCKKNSKQWRHVEFFEKQLAVRDMKNESGVPCLGSALRAQQAGGRYYLQLHWNPSAGCFIVLNEDLSLRDARTGGVDAFFASGLAIGSGNTIHFADVHPETLFVYDPEKRTSQPIYPQKLDPLRKNFSARLAKVISDDRCRERNWACDPSQFSSVLSSLIVNDENQSLAFQTTFEPEGFIDRDEAEDSGLWDDDDYVYIYQLKPFRWREFSVYDLKPKFGTDSIMELLSPANLKKVFATPRPN